MRGGLTLNGNAPANDDLILAEAIRFVGEGVSVTFPVNGRSMLPFIVGGRESVILEKFDSLKIGDVVLAWVDGHHYVIHRIVKMDGEKLTLMGDGNLIGVEHCRVSDVKARAVAVVNARGRRRSLDFGPRKAAAKAWVFLKPVRKWLLLPYRIKNKLGRL